MAKLAVGAAATDNVTHNQNNNLKAYNLKYVFVQEVMKKFNNIQVS